MQDNCSDITNKTRQVIKECLKSRKIVNMRTWGCHSPNRQGDCDPGERLVVTTQGVCKTTYCIDNKDADGRPCLDKEIAYNGTCELWSTKHVCEGEGIGQRLYADLYGAVSCRCSVDLGYVDIDGICYQNWMMTSRYLKNGYIW